MKVLSLLLISAIAFACIEAGKKKPKDKAARKEQKKTANAKVAAAKNKPPSTTNTPPAANNGASNGAASPQKSAQPFTDSAANNKENEKPVWLREAEAMDLLHEMYIIEEGPDAEYPEKTYVEYYTEKFEELKKKVDLDELDRFAVEHYNKLMQEANGKTTSSTGNDSSSSSSTSSTPLNSSSPSSNSASSASSGASSSSSSSANVSLSGQGKKANQQQPANGKQAAKRNNNNNTKSSTTSSTAKSPLSNITAASTSAAPLSTGQGSFKLSSTSSDAGTSLTSADWASMLDSSSSSSSSSSSAESSANSSAVSSQNPSPNNSLGATPNQRSLASSQSALPTAKTAAKAEPEIKENYLPIYYAGFVDQKLKDAFARHLDPLLRGDLSERPIPNGVLKNEQKIVLATYEKLIRAMDPSKEETKQFVRSEFDFDPVTAKPVDFAATRFSAYTAFMSGLKANIKDHFEGIPSDDFTRYVQIDAAINDLHNNAFKPLNYGNSFDGFTAIHAELTKYLTAPVVSLADAVSKNCRVLKLPEGSMDKVEDAPANVIDSLQSDLILPSGIEDCFTAMGNKDNSFHVTDQLIDMAKQVLPSSTASADLFKASELRQKADVAVENIMERVKEDTAYSEPSEFTQRFLKRTLTDWLVGWMAAAAVGHPHLSIDVQDSNSYDQPYYERFWKDVRRASGALREQMLEALRLKLYGDSMTIAFSNVFQIGYSIDETNAVLEHFKKIHSHDEQMLTVFKA